MSNGHLILLAPVGLYEERLWRAIVESEADKIYLIKERKSAYNRVTSEIAETFKERIEKYLYRECDSDESADFTDLEDIYRVFTKIIEKERRINDKASFKIDITSTTKECALVAGSIATLWGARITYVPSKSKIEVTYDELKRDYAKLAKDEGMHIIEIEIPRASSKRSILTEFEKNILKLIYLQGIGNIRVKQIIDICMQTFHSERKGKEAFAKKCHRYIDILAEKGLIRIEGGGRRKIATLTQTGRGIAKGLVENTNFSPK
jgi:sulfite reductase beta subunit-like hemoprotein